MEGHEVKLNLYNNQEDSNGSNAAHSSTSAISKPQEMHDVLHKAAPSLLDNVVPNMANIANSDNLFIVNEPAGEHGGIGNAKIFLNEVKKKGVKRTTSCPPGRGRSLKAGPWSLEWVSRHKGADEGGAATISSVPISYFARVPIVT